MLARTGRFDSTSGSGDRLGIQSAHMAELNGCRERPWVEMFHGKEINDLLLAKKLRPYGIRPKTIWIGEEHAKGYVRLW